jgi:lysozyme
MIYDLLKRHEGVRKKPYKCPAGFLTVGVGWNIDANPLPKDIAAYLKKNGEITDDMVDRLLFISVGAATLNCYGLFPDFENFTENRQMALIDFVFQLGGAGAAKFVNSIAMINTGRWEDAAENMMKSAWAKQTPKRAAEITQMIEEG